MHGISPKDNSLTLRQIKASAEVAKVVPELPTTLCDLISQMAVTDFSLATRMLELGQDGRLIQNQSNQQIINTIEAALSSSSLECDPSIKAQIFLTAYQSYQTGRSTMPYLEPIINAMKKKGLQIILDDVEFKNLDMRHIGGLELSGMSAQRTVFRNVKTWKLIMDHADFTGARFIDTTLEYVNLSNAIITDATFLNVTFCGNEACELTFNQSAIYKCSATYHDLLRIDYDFYQIEKTHLNGIRINAMPDSVTVTFPKPSNLIPFADVFHKPYHTAY